MLTTKTSKSSSESKIIPQTDHTIDQLIAFGKAVAMVQNRNRASNFGYRKILFPLIDSYSKAKHTRQTGQKHSIAGGPALRLAQALWDFHNRQLFPEDDHLRQLEENSTGHFYVFYSKMANDQYYISQAAAAFRTLRVKAFGIPKTPQNWQPEADATQTPLCHALLEMDKTVFSSHVTKRVRNNHVLKMAMFAASNAYPMPEEVPMALAAATQDYALMLIESENFNQYLKARSHYEPLRALQYKHRVQLQSQNKQLNQAINSLCHQIQPSHSTQMNLDL